jgi:hypothetical protein
MPSDRASLKSALAPILGLALFGSVLASVRAASPVTNPPPPAPRAGVMPATLSEASGLAASRRADNLLWAHNDSGGLPVLLALDAAGKLRGKLRIAGVKNTDWEDIASFELDGRAWLLIADTGDNDGKRKDCALLIVAEPDPAELKPDKELTVTVAWRVPVRWPGGARDCEAVAVDAREGKIYLLTKRTVPPELYTLPLRSAPAGSTGANPGALPPLTLPSLAASAPPKSAAPPSIPEAVLVARLAQIPRPTPEQRLLPLPTGRYRAEPTALDFTPDGTAAVVLTYGDAWLFRRAPGQSWADALAAQGERLAPHGLLQGEAAGFSRDGRTVFATGELVGASLVRYEMPVAKP